jgi:hypothetical protein
MFRRIQSELKLRWQFVPGAIASGMYPLSHSIFEITEINLIGPYFSYTVQNKPTGVPPCLKETGKLMVDYAHDYGDEFDTCIEEFVVLGWETTGSKKVRSQIYIYIVCSTLSRLGPHLSDQGPTRVRVMSRS